MTYCDITMHANLIKVKFLGGEARELGGEASPLFPPLDETLRSDVSEQEYTEFVAALSLLSPPSR